jgi:hypothetical protein
MIHQKSQNFQIKEKIKRAFERLDETKLENKRIQAEAAKIKIRYEL